MDLMGEFAVQKTTRSPELGAQEQEEWQNGGWERIGRRDPHPKYLKKIVPTSGGGGKQKENASVILLNWWTECMANAAQQLDVVKAKCPVDDQDIFELKDVLDADQQVIGHLLCGFCRITPSAPLRLLISGYPHSHFSPAGPSASAANSPSLFVSPSAEFRHPP
jgi:hypothetical protein